MAPWYDEPIEAQARAYELAQARLFVLRFILLVGLAALFWRFGWSRELADGLRSHLTFPNAGFVIYLAFVALSVFGYEAILFPLSVYADFSLEKHHHELDDTFGEWLKGYLLTLLIEIAIVSAAFTALFSLIRFLPTLWWLPATAIYAIIVVGLGKWLPDRILPRVRPPTPADAPSLNEAIHILAAGYRIPLCHIAWWSSDSLDPNQPAQLLGPRKRRLLIFSQWAWRDLDEPLQIFLAAREIAHARYRTDTTIHALQILLAAAAFYACGIIAQSAAVTRGVHGGILAPEAFPFVVVALFALASVSGMITHAYARHMELRADRFAIFQTGGNPGILEHWLKADFQHDPFPHHVPFWQSWLLHRMPTPKQRLANAQRHFPTPPQPS